MNRIKLLAASSHRPDENRERGNWSNRVEFTLSAVGYAVGLSNLWRFPYLCYKNGGAAFLIPYFICLVLCVLPLTFLEFVLGQFSGLSAASVWKLCPAFQGLGWASVIVCTIIIIYYNVILAWILYYLGVSLAWQVPWKNCDNHWNTARCTGFSNSAAINTTTDFNDIDYYYDYGNQRKVTAALEYWQNHVLNMSSGIDDLGRPQWKLVVCLLATWIIIFLCLIKGIKSSGKVVYATATIPYLFILILIFRGATLPGSLEGIAYYMVPDWSRLMNWTVWTDALIQAFYSVFPAVGSLITMASYNRFHDNCMWDALIMCGSCAGTSFLAGFVVFSVLGFMARQTGMTINEFADAGSGLAFVAYPEAIAHMPVAPFFAICFFLMMLTMALDTQFVMVETVISCLVDSYPQTLRQVKTLLTAIVCGVCFILGLPMVTRGGYYLLQILDTYPASVASLVIAIAECLVIVYVYGIGQIYRDMACMFKRKPIIVWAVAWGIITPVMLFATLMSSTYLLYPLAHGQYLYPTWATAFGWLLALVSLLPIPVAAVYNTCIITAKGLPFTLHAENQVRPSADWGPALEDYRESYQAELRQRTWFQKMWPFFEHRSPVMNTTPMVVVAGNVYHQPGVGPEGVSDVHETEKVKL